MGSAAAAAADLCPRCIALLRAVPPPHPAECLTAPGALPSAPALHLFSILQISLPHLQTTGTMPSTAPGTDCSAACPPSSPRRWGGREGVARREGGSCCTAGRLTGCAPGLPRCCARLPLALSSASCRWQPPQPAPHSCCPPPPPHLAVAAASSGRGRQALAACGGHHQLGAQGWAGPAGPPDCGHPVWGEL